LKKYLKKINEATLDDIMYVVWGIYIITTFLNTVSVFFQSEVLQLVLKVVRYLCYIISTIKIVADWKKGLNVTIPMIVISILSLIILLVTSNRNIFLTFLILIALRNLQFNKLISIALKLFLLMFFIVVSLAILKIIPNWEFSRGTLPRYALGFSYATDAIGTYLIVILMYFYIRNSKATYIELIVLETINILIFDYTNGRASFLLISVILFTQLLSKFNWVKEIFYSKIIQKIVKLSCYTLPIVLFVLFHMFICLYSMNNTIANKVNKILSDRIKYTYQTYRTNEVQLFGSNIEWNGWGGYGYTNLDEIEEFEYNFVDSSYARILFDYGLIFSCLVLVGYTTILIKNYNRKNYKLVLTIFFVLIWSFIEQYIIDLGKNVFVIAFIPILEMIPINCLNYNNVKLTLKKIKKKEEKDEI